MTWYKLVETNSQERFSAPKKSLGQNFLQDPNIIRKIVAALNIKPQDKILEIGPGRGALTELILAEAAVLHLVEFDRELVNYWQQRCAQHPNLSVHASDILKFDMNEALLDHEGPIKVVGNLPYKISSPVLFHLLPFASRIQSQLFMLQKEVVDRMSAAPGNKQYGRLSVMLQQRYSIEALFTVPATAFFPAPKVASAMVRLTPHQNIPHPIESQTQFEKLVKQAFSQRRKTLRNCLKGLLTSNQIEQVGIDPGVRAETLSVGDFTALTELI